MNKERCGGIVELDYRVLEGGATMADDSSCPQFTARRRGLLGGMVVVVEEADCKREVAQEEQVTGSSRRLEETGGFDN